MDALTAIDRWDVGAAAAAVFTAEVVLEARGPVDRSFPLASVSKVIASLATMIAVEEGIVALDDPAGPAGSSLRHLLAHASGLGPDPGSAPLAGPGTRRIYSNAGFEALGDHVAAAAGMPFGAYAHDALVDPLALASTDVGGSPAHGYSSSVLDLVALVQAALGGELIAAETAAQWTTPAFPDLAGVLPGFGRQDPNPWGLGVEVRGTKDPHWTAPGNSPATWGHFGQSGTFVWFDPVAALGLVVLTDRAFGPWAAEAWPALSAVVLATP